jgi:hypothetical protein
MEPKARTIASVEVAKIWPRDNPDDPMARVDSDRFRLIRATRLIG